MEGKSPGQTKPPGKILMNIHDMTENVLVAGHIWKQLLQWYELSETHELDRRYIDPDSPEGTTLRKPFKICFLNALADRVSHRRKDLDLTEFVGYIECQVRCVLRVCKDIPSRLWVRKDDTDSKFEMLLDRTEELRWSYAIEDHESYILALELRDANGFWPSGFQQDPHGHLQVFRDVTSGKQRANINKDDITVTMETLTDSLIQGVNVIAQNFIEDMHKLHCSQKEESEKFKEMVYSVSQGLNDTKSKLEHKSKALSNKEFYLAEDMKKLQINQEIFQNEKSRFQKELECIAKLNKVSETIVTLNVGGQYFMTSTVTLTRDPNCMLGVMFSGRHKLHPLNDGSYFIDRDSMHFTFILNYLRDGNIESDDELSTNEEKLNELLAEAEFYSISDLVEKLTRIKQGLGKSVIDLLFDE